ncbi:MAG: hypothetical protein HC808_14495, partial [Candidatus Competibacteraceae bacterium]|nr:hypothetical protein [Candidatus Competibacteraceae bacterium]
MAAPSVRHLFDGIERADSFIVDPHKWLFAPFDSCALLYRDPAVARAAHTQHAEYLDVLHADDAADEPWNPSDYAHHLSRRARGLPLWFSLATHGTDAYTEAVEATLDYADIPHFPVSTATSHRGRLVFGTLRGLPVMVMEGRMHAYEGYPLSQITLPVRVMKALGAELMIVSQAVGGMNPLLQAGRRHADRRSHQPAGRQPAGRRKRRPPRPALPR